MRNLKSQKNKRTGVRRKSTRRVAPKKGRQPTKLDINYVNGYLNNILLDAYTSISSYSKADFTKDKETIHRRLTAEGSSFVTKTLPLLAKGLFDLLEHGQASFPSFKIKRGGIYPVFLKGLFRLAVTGTKNESTATAIKYIYNFAVSFKKLKGQYSKAVLLLKWMEFCDVDDSLMDVVVEDDVLKRSRGLMGLFIRNIDMNDTTRFIPRPGPGATNRPVEKHMRYEPHVLYSQLDSVFPYQEWFYSHPWDAVEQSRQFLNLHKNKVELPSSRMKYVPKTWDTPRGICIEENEVQFLQQGMRRGLTSYMEEDPELKDHIPLRDQSVNAELALSSSLSLSSATIDESEASDRIARALVSYHFQDNPELHDALMALSTRVIVLPEEQRLAATAIGAKLFLNTKKYAPMGSGLCFPVMSLLHYMLIKAIILCSTMHNRHMYSKQVYVYGDDVIIPTACAGLVFEQLPKYGMKLNNDKSFVASHFRESCGIHAYAGKNITPVYVKHTPKHPSFESLLSNLANERDLYDKGYANTAEFLRKSIIQVFGDMPTLVNGASGIGFYRPDACDASFRSYRGGLKRKWDADLQCYQYRVRTLIKRSDLKPIDKQCSAYLRALTVGNTLASKLGKFETAKVGDSSGDIIARWTWVPESSLKVVCGSTASKRYQ